MSKFLSEKDYQEIDSLKKIKFSLKDIKKFRPCKEGIDRYLKVFRSEEVITWKEFITRYNQKSDILWLYNKIKRSLKII